MPPLDRGGLHQVGAVLPCLQELGQQDPQEAGTWREPWAWILLFLDAMLANGQLALYRQKPRGQHYFRLHHCQEEGDDIFEKLTDELKGLMGVPDQVLKGAHARKIAILPQHQETRKFLSYNHDGIFRRNRVAWAIDDEMSEPFLSNLQTWTQQQILAFAEQIHNEKLEAVPDPNAYPETVGVAEQLPTLKSREDRITI